MVSTAPCLVVHEVLQVVDGCLCLNQRRLASRAIVGLVNPSGQNAKLLMPIAPWIARQVVLTEACVQADEVELTYRIAMTWMLDVSSDGNAGKRSQVCRRMHARWLRTR